VNRSIGSGYGYGYGYDGQMSDPQGMPLTGNAPWGWGTTGHAANRHCPPGNGGSGALGRCPSRSAPLPPLTPAAAANQAPLALLLAIGYWEPA
jgi:hypothetical protein